MIPTALSERDLLYESRDVDLLQFLSTSLHWTLYVPSRRSYIKRRSSYNLSLSDKLMTQLYTKHWVCLEVVRQLHRRLLCSTKLLKQCVAITDVSASGC